MKSVMLSILTATVISIGAFVILHSKEATMTELLVTKINDIRTEMEKDAQTTGLAQVDAVAETVVHDCSVRDRYESLLGKLDTLTQDELKEVQQLHAQCSHYYPTQKAFMVNRLETHLSQYKSLISILESVKGLDPEDYQVAAWQSLVAKESTRSMLLRQQYEIQGRIIEVLISKNPEDLNTLLEEAKKNADSLNVISIQINGERDALIRV